MPSKEEIAVSQAEARVEELEGEVERLKQTNEKLSRRLDTDRVVQKIGELNLELGRAKAELEAAQKKVEKLQATAEAQAQEKLDLSATLSEKIREISNADGRLKETMKALQASQVALAARSWAPWICTAVVVVVVMLLAVKGIIIPRTGDLAADVCATVNQLNALEQDRRTREVELQKPHQAWGVSKCMTSDENAALGVNIYTNEKSYAKSQTNFIGSLILTACRDRLNVIKFDREFLSVVTEQGTPQLPLQTSDQIVAFLNRELGKNGLELIQEKVPEFNVSFQIQFLKAEEKNRNTGYGLFFRNGRFTDKPEQAREGRGAGGGA
jgi:hypothetical protein